MNHRTKATVLIVIGLAALGALAIYGNGNSKRAPPDSAATMEMKRLFLENHSEDDLDRDVGFRALLEKKGHRCDKVERMLKDLVEQSPGAVWHVSCSPGYRYTFLFSADGLPSRLWAE